MRYAVKFRRAGWVSLLCWGLLPGDVGSAQSAASTEGSFRNRLTGDARGVLQRIMTGTRRRLAHPACQALFADFVDRDKRTLSAILDAESRTAIDYFDELYFVEANNSHQCQRSPALIAFTAVRGRIIYVCTRPLIASLSQDASAGEILLIHELLHAIGLGEDPPSSAAITARVWTRCGRSKEHN